MVAEKFRQSPAGVGSIKEAIWKTVGTRGAHGKEEWRGYRATACQLRRDGST
jgi:hypothetical protein